MKRAKSIGTVTFEINSLFIKEEEENDSIVSEMFMSSDGTHIVFEAEIYTPYITLSSKSHGWINETQRLELVSMWKQLDTTFTLTYTDNTTETVRFAREKKMQLIPISEGAELYRGLIPLAKV